jgi:hypothetical protein
MFDLDVIMSNTPQFKPNVPKYYAWITRRDISYIYNRPAGGPDQFVD